MGSMGLVLPVVGVTAGTAWATLLNTALSPNIEEHDHSAGKGLFVKTSGLVGINVNGDLNFQDIDAASPTFGDYNRSVNLRSIRLNQLTTPGVPAGFDPDTLTVMTDLMDLWYRDGAGTLIQLTSGGGPVGSGKQYGFQVDYDAFVAAKGWAMYETAGTKFTFKDDTAGAYANMYAATLNNDTGNLALTSSVEITGTAATNIVMTATGGNGSYIARDTSLVQSTIGDIELDAKGGDIEVHNSTPGDVRVFCNNNNLEIEADDAHPLGTLLLKSNTNTVTVDAGGNPAAGTSGLVTLTGANANAGNMSQLDFLSARSVCRGDSALKTNPMLWFVEHPNTFVNADTVPQLSPGPGNAPSFYLSQMGTISAMVGVGGTSMIVGPDGGQYLWLGNYSAAPAITTLTATTNIFGQVTTAQTSLGPRHYVTGLVGSSAPLTGNGTTIFSVEDLMDQSGVAPASPNTQLYFKVEGGKDYNDAGGAVAGQGFIIATAANNAQSAGTVSQMNFLSDGAMHSMTPCFGAYTNPLNLGAPWAGMDLGTTFWTPAVGPSPHLATNRRSASWRNIVTAKSFHTVPVTKPHDLVASTAGSIFPNAQWTANSYELTARHALNAVVAQGHIIGGWTGALGTGTLDVRHWNCRRTNTIAPWVAAYGQFLGNVAADFSRCAVLNQFQVLFDISVSTSCSVSVTNSVGAPITYSHEWIMGAAGEAVGMIIHGWDIATGGPIGSDCGFAVIGSPYGASFDPAVYEGNVAWPDSGSPD